MTHYKPPIDLNQDLGPQLLPPHIAIPDDTTSIDLSGLKLGELPIGTLEKIIVALPESITAINLSNVFNDDIDGAHLERLLNALANKNIVNINLSHNHFHRLAPHVLRQAFEVIRHNIKKLDISNNFQGSFCQYRLKAVMQVLNEAPNLQHLDISGNIDVSISELPLLHRCLKQLPKKSITCLALNDSCLGALEQTELNELLKNIPSTVTTLHLGGERYGFLSHEKYFKKLIIALSHVKKTTNIWQIRFPAHIKINIPLDLLLEMQSLLAENGLRVVKKSSSPSELTQLSSYSFFTRGNIPSRSQLWYELDDEPAKQHFSNFARDLDIQQQEELLGIRIFPITTDLVSLCREKSSLLSLKYHLFLLLQMPEKTLLSTLEKDAKKNPAAGPATVLEEYKIRQAKQVVFDSAYRPPAGMAGS